MTKQTIAKPTGPPTTTDNIVASSDIDSPSVF